MWVAVGPVVGIPRVRVYPFFSPVIHALAALIVVYWIFPETPERRYSGGGADEEVATATVELNFVSIGHLSSITEFN